MDNFQPVAIDWTMIMPVVLVVATGVLTLIIKMLRMKRPNNALIYLTLIGLAAAGIHAGTQLNLPVGETLGQMFVRDRLSLLVQILLIGIALLTVFFSEGYLREKHIAYGEFYPLVTWATAGAMLMVSTKNLLMIFMGLEVLSVALYVLAGMSRQESRSEESAMKYLLLGAFMSCFLLYGIAFHYGATGGLHFSLISMGWSSHDLMTQRLLLFGLGMLLIGLLFKGSFVPFHTWTPDVYQGAPTNVTTFMAAATKVAAIVVLYRVLDASLLLRELWMPLLFWVSILTMTLGNVVAILQKDVKRIISYSSIAHAGYILVALLAHLSDPERISLSTTLFYLVAYSLMTVGALAVIALMARGGQESTRVEDLHGLWQRSPFAAVALLIFMLSFIGVPPTAGFFGKFLIFRDALQAGFMPLAILLGVNSMVSIYYYMGIARAAFMTKEPEERPRSAVPGFGWLSACTVCVLGTLMISFFAQILASWVEKW
jgi:NADH-quinone oxidoreductase subunit N